MDAKSTQRLPAGGRVALFAQGKTQADIARAHGDCNRSYVCRCMNGRQRPSKRLVEVACELTNLPASVLFEGYEEPADE